MNKRNGFFSAQRLSIISFGIISSVLIILIVLSGANNKKLTADDLLINLAASLLTISVTAAIVDYLTKKEFEEKTFPMFISGLREYEQILGSMGLTILNVHGYYKKLSTEKYTSNSFSKQNDERAKRIVGYLNEISLHPTGTLKVNKEIFDEFHSAVNEAYSRIDKFLNVYTFYLPSDMLNQVIRTKDGLSRAKGVMDYVPEKDLKKHELVVEILIGIQAMYIVDFRKIYDVNAHQKLSTDRIIKKYKLHRLKNRVLRKLRVNRGQAKSALELLESEIEAESAK